MAKDVLQDQWQAQIQALILQKANVFVYSDGLQDEQIRAVMLNPCRNIETLVKSIVKEQGNQTRIGIMPEGPQTIPYLRGEVID